VKKRGGLGWTRARAPLESNQARLGLRTRRRHKHTPRRPRSRGRPDRRKVLYGDSSPQLSVHRRDVAVDPKSRRPLSLSLSLSYPPSPLPLPSRYCLHLHHHPPRSGVLSSLRAAGGSASEFKFGAKVGKAQQAAIRVSSFEHSFEID